MEKGEEGVLTDDASLEEFYEANVRRLFTALCLVRGDRHEAEEVAQEAFRSLI
jgi:DNA-directed RNA polymerase specialized sigma24 family protein